MVNNVTSFVIAASVAAGITSIIGASSVSATNSGTCIDASKKSNLVVKWSGNNSVTVSTKGDKAACKDTTMYLSAFVMPDTWDGKGFNSTAVPQSLHKSVSATFKANVAKPVAKLTVQMPAVCKNVQTDVYYAPEQTVITSDNLIGSRLIGAKHQKATGTCEVVTPETPVVPETPVTPETPKVISDAVTNVEVPAELPKTGAGFGLLGLLASGLAAYKVVYRLRK